MKVYCEQCKKDISKSVDFNFEKIILGKIKCPHCGNVQGRFISDTDMLLYLGICETIYTLLTILGIYIYDGMSENWWLIILFLLLLVLIVFIQKNVSRFVYKKELVKLPINEQRDIKKTEETRTDINRSFMIYSVFAMLAILFENYRVEFVLGTIALTVATFVKFYLNIRQYKETKK